MTSIRITVKEPLETLRSIDILAAVREGIDIARNRSTDFRCILNLSNSIADAIQDRLKITKKAQKVKVPKDDFDSDST